MLELEYRMYGLVPYNISPIQQGIQFGHAVVEYGQKCKGGENESLYHKFANFDKTFIILNGGTTNENPNRLGTLQQHAKLLKDNNIFTAEFREPDLNDTLTAVVFLVDERVFNRVKYPDMLTVEEAFRHLSCNTYNKVLFLREFLENFKLA